LTFTFGEEKRIDHHPSNFKDILTLNKGNRLRGFEGQNFSDLDETLVVLFVGV
jgi:hypothetical protein